ncbi:MAG: ABC transporter permease [Candidatus Helarchaeota archaeon]|nr:ABC transporter permease [Candidatus Helarchaeota archaeon]
MNKVILYVAERDLRFIVNNFIFLLVQYISFIIQIFIYSLVLNALIPLLNYVEWYSTGMTILTLWSISMYTVYFVYGEKTHGILQYILTLPITRRDYVIGRVIGSSIRTMVYIMPLFFITLIVTGVSNIINLIMVIGLLYLFIFGVTGLAVTLGSAVKGERRLDIMMGVVDAFMIRISTVYYPQYAMDLWMQVGSQINPLSHISTIFRWALGLKNFYSLEFPPELIISIIFIIVLSTFFFFISLKIYEGSIEGGEHG